MDRTLPQNGRPRLLKYLLLIVLVITLIASTAFLIVTRPSYEQWSVSRWGSILEYSFDTDPQNADVVIFGDSSAFLGIEPKIVNAQLHIKSLILPATIGSLPVLNDKPLQTYLAHNRPPRLIVLYFAAWDLNYRTAKTALFEGEEMLLRHGTGREIAQYELHHPAELIRFPFRFYNGFTPKAITAAFEHTDRHQAIAAALGHVDYTDPKTPVPAPCEIPAPYLAATSTASVQDLIHRYTTPDTHVLVYLAPVPDCSNTHQVIHRSYQEVGAAPPFVLPPDDFANDPYYAHIRPPFVPTASTLFAGSLASRLTSLPAPLY